MERIKIILQGPYPSKDIFAVQVPVLNGNYVFPKALGNQDEYKILKKVPPNDTNWLKLKKYWPKSENLPG